MHHSTIGFILRIALSMVVFVPTWIEAQTCPVKTDYVPVAGIDLAMSDGHVYVTTGTDLFVFDTSDPSDVVQVGHWPQFAQGIEIDGDYAFVSTGLDFVVLDISDPTNPLEIDRLVNPFSATIQPWFCVNGNNAYLLATNTAVVIQLFPSLQVANNDFASPYSPKDLKTAGQTIFLSFGRLTLESGIGLYDLSTPSTPVLVGGILFDQVLTGMVAEGTHLFVVFGGSSSQGEVYDVSNPVFPVQIGVFDAHGTAVDANGNFLHVFGDDLYTFNVADPQVPVELGSIPTLDPATRIVADGNILASLSDAAGLEVFDIINCEWASKPDCNLDGVVDGADISCILGTIY